jgi:uncharacterized membrane protein YccF (DUF307 family)
VALAVVGLALHWRARAALLKGAAMGLFGLWVAASTVHHAIAATVPHGEIMSGVGLLALQLISVSPLFSTVTEQPIARRYRYGCARATTASPTSP